MQASGKPYYRAIDPSLHLGYRKGKAGGKWVMRWYLGDGAYQVGTIGTADDSADPDGVVVLDFRQAQALVREKYLEYARAAQGLPAKDGPYAVKCAWKSTSRSLKQTGNQPGMLAGGPKR